MQLQSYGNVATTKGMAHTQSFQMQMNAKMFNILTDKLYQNKEGAVIRELSANARDAHVEANKDDQPFEITMPSWLSSTFKIRDFGTGIDPAEFYDIYTNLGHSTKDDENTSIGAYGLGSKTPFAITDQYTIRNYYNGHMYLYTAYKDEGMPTVSLVGDMPTEESNGLEIEVNIPSRSSISKIQEEVKRQLAYFEVKPTIKGMDDFEWIETPELHMGYSVTTGHYHSDVTVVMGGIPYVSSISNFPEELRQKLYRLTLVLVAKLGEIDIPPSRESIEFTPKTIKFVGDKIEEIKEDYKHDFAYRVKNAKNEVELGNILESRITEWISNRKHETELYTFKNEILTGGELRNILDSSLIGVNVKENKYYYKTLRSNYNSSSISTIQRTILNRRQETQGEVYLNDLSPRANKVIQLHKSALLVNSAVVFPNEGKSKLFPEAANKAELMLKNLGFKPIRLSTLMSMPVVVAGAPKSKVYSRPDQVFKVGTNGDVLKESVRFMPEEGYFVNMSNWNMSESKEYLACMVSVLGKEVYALRSHARGEASRSGGKWISVNTLEDQLVKGLTAKMVRAENAYLKSDILTKEVNCETMFTKELTELLAENPNWANTKLSKLSKACRLIKEEYNKSRLSFAEDLQIEERIMCTPKAKGKIPENILKLAKQAKENYSEALTATFKYERWDKSNKSLSQTINLIVGNFK